MKENTNIFKMSLDADMIVGNISFKQFLNDTKVLVPG